jgi:hypothetical protein
MSVIAHQRRITTLALTVLGLVGLALAGCADECEENLHCELGQVCSAGQCEDATCVTSDQCAMETFCAQESGVCEPGCQTDRDCYPYNSCNQDNQCVNAGCRSTVLDCAFGEFCNTLTGECFDASGAYCRECEGYDDEEECGAGNLCVTIGGYPQPYCGVDCSLGQECPRGYDCGAVQDPSGNIRGYVCITTCWTLDD